MSEATLDEWREFARDELAALRAHARQVGVLGLSLGALLCLDLAADDAPRVDAIAALAAPILISNYDRIRLLLVRRAQLWRFKRTWPKSRSLSDFADPDLAQRHTRMAASSLRGLAEMDMLRVSLIPRLHRITAPLFVAHGELDKTVPAGNARYLASRVGSRDVELHLFAKSGHVLPVDAEGDEIARLTTDFFVRHLPVRAEAVA